MAADAYIRTAITHLQSAITDMQQQMNGLQTQVNQQKQQLQQEINHMDTERRGHEAEITHVQDNAQRRVLENRVGQINKQCDEKRAQMTQLDNELSATTQRKTQAYNDLRNLSQQLDRLMASPDIH